jgi:hypothetical protein
MKHLGFLTVVSVTLLISACGDAFSPEAISGFYELVSINGNSLPYTMTYTEDGVTVEATINGGSITLSENETFGTAVDLEISGAGMTLTQTFTASGTFTLVEPATVQFTTEFGEQYSGVLSGDRLTVAEQDGSFVYER